MPKTGKIRCCLNGANDIVVDYHSEKERKGIINRWRAKYGNRMSAIQISPDIYEKKNPSKKKRFRGKVLQRKYNKDSFLTG